MYEEGRGVEINLKEAAVWYQKAADQEDAQAQNNLGRMYEKGTGVVQDIRKAVQWYKMA